MCQTPIVQRANRQAWLGLITILGLVALVAMDGSVLYLAMPKITSALAPSADQTLWILDIYGFIVGSLLVVFGNIGDRYGRLKLIMGGAMIFGIASIGAALSTTPEGLIAFRALMGVGGATLLPSGLAIISNLFPNPKQRAHAIGIFAATFAGGFAVGPLIGGVLLNNFNWGAVFLINVPVVLIFLLSAPVLLNEVRAQSTYTIDVPSLALSFTGILLFTYSLKTAAAYGVSTHQLLSGLIGIFGLVLFIRRQRRIVHPLIDVSLFTDRVFTVAILTGFLSLVVWSVSGYLAGVYIQSVLGFNVFATALLTIPGALVLTASCIWTSKIVEIIGKKWALIMTHLLISCGMILLLLTDIQRGAGLYIASTMIAGIGYGLSFSLVAEIAISAAPQERAGAAAAIAETSNEIGNAIGISVLGSLAALWFRLAGPDIAGTLNETLDTSGLTIETIVQAQNAFLTGMHIVVAVAGSLTLAAALLAAFWLPKSLSEQ